MVKKPAARATKRSVETVAKRKLYPRTPGQRSDKVPPKTVSTKSSPSKTFDSEISNEIAPAAFTTERGDILSLDEMIASITDIAEPEAGQASSAVGPEVKLGAVVRGIPSSIPVKSAMQGREAKLPTKRRKSSASRTNLIGRIVKVIDGQLDLIDAMTADPDRSDVAGGGTERYARTVATLARVLAELRKEQVGDKRRPANDDHRPRDLDDLRERLSRRLAQRLDDGSAPPAGGHDAG